VNAVSYLDILKLAAPETILVLTALVVMVIDLTALRGEPRQSRLLLGGAFAVGGCVLTLAWMLNSETQGQVGQGMLLVTPLTLLVKTALVGLTIFTVLLSLGTDFTDHVGEYYGLLLLATVGMMFLVSAEDILMIFVALELTSLSLYILTAFNKRNPKSAEAALKYFLFGGLAAAFMLFGLSLLYGLTGSTSLAQITAKLGGPGPDPLLAAALVMIVAGFGFKVAAAPFHLWAPDVYEGAPTPSAAFIASGSKVAGFFILARVLMLGFSGSDVAGSAAWRQFASGWMPLLAGMSVLSMVLGNLAAIAQTNVRRLLAYSAIAHAGYVLLAILAPQQAGANQGLSALLYYVVTYALTTLGAFGVVAVIEARAGDSRLADFAGLSHRAPLLALCMMVFMLSLAGIPPLAGFFGKFYVFTVAAAGARDLGLLWLVILAVALSAVSLYYYLQVLKQIYVAAPANGASAMAVPISSQVVLALLALSVVVLGCAPGLLLDRIAACL